MKPRVPIAAGVLGILGISMVGVGAQAALGVAQKSSIIMSQNIDIAVSASGAAGNGTSNITLAPTGPTGSSFLSTNDITITNSGSIPVNEIAYELSDDKSDATLESETWVCLYGGGHIYFNEPLSTLTSYGDVAKIGTIAPGATDKYAFIIYAGTNEDSGCGSTYTSYVNSSSSDGQVLSHSYTGAESYSGTSPSFGPNPSAPSLMNAAEGRTLTATFTARYTGSSLSTSARAATSAQGKKDIEISAKKSPVMLATSVHTGEPWAGSGPFASMIAALGLLFMSLGIFWRRRASGASRMITNWTDQFWKDNCDESDV